MGVGVTLYLWYRRQQKLPATARVELEKLTLPGYQEIPIKKILVPTTGSAVNETVQFAAKLAKMHGAPLSTPPVIEIPPSLPLDTFFPEKLTMADSILQQAQAIGRE